MIILILVDDEDSAAYMFNSIFDEKYEIKYYYNKILELNIIDKKLISYNNKSLLLDDIFFNKDKYSFNSLIYKLQKEIKKISLPDDCLYKFDYFVNNYWLNEYLSGFKEIITIIIKSKYYSTIISELFNKKENEINFIQSDEFINYLFSKINIIPIFKEEVPFMDKFSLDIFLGGYDSESMNLNGSKEYRDKIDLY